MMLIRMGHGQTLLRALWKCVRTNALFRPNDLTASAQDSLLE